MAWVQKEVVTKVREALKVLNKEYGMKTSVSGTNSSSLKVRILSGKIDFIQNRIDMLTNDNRYTEAEKAHNIKYMTEFNSGIQVNHYWLDTVFSGIALEYLEKLKAIMSVDHWDKSDIQSDYFNCAYFMNIDIGTWDKPYVVTN